MSAFRAMQEAITQQMAVMATQTLFRVALDRDEIVETYLSAFPAGTNEVYRERAEHDCSCCKQFLRSAGGMVAITPTKMITIWDITVDDPTYQAVADAMAAYVRCHIVTDKFLHYENHIGTHHNFEAVDDGAKRWDHFYVSLPPGAVADKDQIDTLLGKIRTNKEMYLRAMDDLSLDALNTVADLIAQNSIYRGEEHKKSVTEFTKARKAWDKYKPAKKGYHMWIAAVKSAGICRFKNSVIGTLVTDLSSGVELEDAVKMYESKVAPENYKRTTALVTPAMIQKAQEKVEELGLGEALYRRHATTEDLTINNVLFADRSAKKVMNVFDEVAASAGAKKSLAKFDKVQEVGIDAFITEILPTAETLEIMFEGRHKNNLMSVIAPIHAETPNMLKWGNNFSWSYAGEVTDSIKERVKQAGGSVTGDLRFSLAWFNSDDLDLHLKEPGGNDIGFSNMRSPTGGRLDVDMNAGGRNNSTNPVENITYPQKSMLKPGKYELYVHQYTKRNNDNGGFIVEMEFMGEKTQFHYEDVVRSGSRVKVIKFTYSKDAGIAITESLPAEGRPEDLWGVSTQQFRKVKMLMNSPNHWDDQKIGNKHWFFILENCKNDDTARGFFNEFLNAELTEHRKVFEILGSKTKVEDSDEQLSGLGFSSTKPDHVLCKVAGSFDRVIKVVF